MGFWSFLRDMVVLDGLFNLFKKKGSQASQATQINYDVYDDCVDDHHYDSGSCSGDCYCGGWDDGHYASDDYYHDSADDYAHDFDDFEDDY